MISRGSASGQAGSGGLIELIDEVSTTGSGCGRPIVTFAGW